MKPIGTITNTLLFIDEEYRADLDALIDESVNYSDFSKKLCDYVISNDTSDELAYIALFHANRTSNYPCMKKIRSKHHDSQILRYFHIVEEESTGIQWDWALIIREVDNAIHQTDNLFIKMDLYYFKWLATRMTDPSSMDEDRIVQKMQELIDDNSEIRFLQANIHLIEANQKERETSWEEALDCYRIAYEIAAKYGDCDLIGEIKLSEGYTLARICDPRALEAIGCAKRIITEMGYIDRRANLMSITAIVHATRGEYNRACELMIETLAKREEIHEGGSLRLFPTALSRYFRRMNQLDEAVEWAKTGLESTPAFGYFHTHARQALANICLASSLALQGKVDAAHSYLDKANKLIIESGGELWLSDLYLCQGFIERAEGNLYDAMNYFRRSYDIVTRMRRQDRINEAVFRLAETEILLRAEDCTDFDTGATMSWTQQLEDMALAMELPGIIGLAYFLKAKLLISQDNSEEAKEYLLRVMRLASNPETQYLMNYLEPLPLYQEVLADIR